MLKFTVPFIIIFKACFLAQQSKKRQYLQALTFLKILRNYNPFLEKTNNEDKILMYWMHHSIPEIIKTADRLFEEEKYLEVYELLNRIRYTRETEVLWRIARALYHLSFDNAVNEHIKWEMINEASDVLSIALPIGEDSFEVHKWTAVILDTHHGLVNLECRVKNAENVRNHLIRACELNPGDFISHYMLGKWCFDMSRLNWFQRCIAKYVVASDPPRASYEEAYRYLSRAEELHPRTFLPNLYLLGQTCLAIGQYYKAKYYLNMAINLPPKDDCERTCITKAKRLIKKLERYDLGKHVLFYGDDTFGFND